MQDIDVYEEIYEYEKAHLADVRARILAGIEELKADGFEYGNVNIYDEREVEEIEEATIRHNDNKYFAEVLQKALDEPYFARMLLEQTDSQADSQVASYTKRRTLFREEEGEKIIDMYVGRELIMVNGSILVYSHNSELGNRVYDRINGTIEYNGFRYDVKFRRKFDITGGELLEVFQDYKKGEDAPVYDKFLARMLEKKRGDKFLTDIIPTIQANQNAIITRPAAENAIVQGCAGSGKTMILMQRLEYLNFNRKIDFENVRFLVPSREFSEHVEPVMKSLHLTSVRRRTVGEFYYALTAALNRGNRYVEGESIAQDSVLPADVIKYVYSDEFAKKVKLAARPLIRDINAKLQVHRARMKAYEQELALVGNNPSAVTAQKPEPFRYPITIFNRAFDGIRPKEFSRDIKCKATGYCNLLVNRVATANELRPITLFIDEAQDLFVNELRLLKSIFSEVTFNLFGDINQRVYADRGLSSWTDADGVADFKHYELNENYRNAFEITDFCNKTFGYTASALGLVGGRVEKADGAEAFSRLSEAGEGARIAVVRSANRTAPVPTELCGFPQFTAEEAKGMEFEAVAALTEGMTASERYVAFTRALDSLFVVDN